MSLYATSSSGCMGVSTARTRQLFPPSRRMILWKDLRTQSPRTALILVHMWQRSPGHFHGVLTVTDLMLSSPEQMTTRSSSAQVDLILLSINSVNGLRRKLTRSYLTDSGDSFQRNSYILYYYVVVSKIQVSDSIDS